MNLSSNNLEDSAASVRHSHGAALGASSPPSSFYSSSPGLPLSRSRNNASSTRPLSRIAKLVFTQRGRASVIKSVRTFFRAQSITSPLSSKLLLILLALLGLTFVSYVWATSPPISITQVQESAFIAPPTDMGLSQTEASAVLKVGPNESENRHGQQQLAAVPPPTLSAPIQKADDLGGAAKREQRELDQDDESPQDNDAAESNNSESPSNFKANTVYNKQDSGELTTRDIFATDAEGYFYPPIFPGNALHYQGRRGDTAADPPGGTDVKEGVDEDHLHGIVGLDDERKPLWTPQPISFKQSFEQKVKAHTGYCFNTRISRSISLDRKVPDYNSKRCKAEVYPPDMPKASVIIVFHNEDFSVLIRSVHSVLNRTPPELLEQIILVDDNSNKTTHPWLFEELDHYITTTPKTVVRRLPRRYGLMMARMAGTEWCKAPVGIYLDSHIECAPGYAQPLIHAIYKNRKTIVVPMIHTIDDDDFSFESNHLSVLGFSWTLGQTHPERPQSDYAPMESPVMAGGLFATDIEWFLDLGGYDPEMRLYGGEEMEIGFKTWMCGGRLEAIPCSRVGHVFRSGKYWKHQVYKVPGEEIHRNKLRAAEVWMDEYAQFAKIAISKLPKGMSLGPLDEVKAVRTRLQCKSFKWYLENVFPDLWVPKIEGGKAGAIRAVALDACIDTLTRKGEGSRMGAYPCHHQHGTQAFLFDADGYIRIADSDFRDCIRGGKNSIASFLMESDEVTLTTKCSGNDWQYDESTQQIIAKSTLSGSGVKKCLQATKVQTPESPFLLNFVPCDSNSKYQKFEFDLVK